MESTLLGDCIGIFLKNFFSNFCSHIKDSKWGRKCIFINCKRCNGSSQQIQFQFANGKLPHSRYRAFWAVFLLGNPKWHRRFWRWRTKKNSFSNRPRSNSWEEFTKSYLHNKSVTCILVNKFCLTLRYLPKKLTWFDTVDFSGNFLWWYLEWHHQLLVPF